ncbi:MAG: ABC transporter ATP-binding protein [Planctomycetes bacterium]|nr:ABC transporter ATP-binding protein [Planctomycetota bacterium]
MIETRDIRVDYDDVTAVRDLTLSIGTGEVFGLIGPNGAGKSSTIRVMATLQRPTYGDVKIGGIDIATDPAAVRRMLGYMPDMPPVYEDITCTEFLELFAGCYFMNRKDRRRRIDECLDQVDLTGKSKALAGTLSRGMRQRLVLAKTLLHDPDVLLLDEPASGLDPIARIDMRNSLVALSHLGKTVLVSSHILTELSEFCTSIGIMEKGVLVESGSISDIVQRLNGHRRFVVEIIKKPEDSNTSPEADHCVGVLETIATVAGAATQQPSATARVLAPNTVRVEFGITALEDVDEAAAAVLQKLVTHGVCVSGFYEKKVGVEDILLQVGAREVS